MIRNASVEEQQCQLRLETKTLDSQFLRRLEQGIHCAPFVAQVILKTVKEIYPFAQDVASNPLGLGQLKLLVVAADEPAGKSLEQCQKVAVLLTLDAPEDFQVRSIHGVDGLRRARLMRLAADACEQGGVLSYEDLAFRLLNCAVRTIVRDIHLLQRQGISVPTRGQQQGIGPGQTHRVQAVRLYLQGLEAREIARKMYHTLSAIENYATTFSRVVLLANKGYADDEIAFVIGRSRALIAAYRQLYADFAHERTAQKRLHEILSRAQPIDKASAQKKRGRRS